MGFVFIEANVKKWGLAPMTGSLAPPPPYGSEAGSILLESGADKQTTTRWTEWQEAVTRSRQQARGAAAAASAGGANGNDGGDGDLRVYIQPPPGPVRSPTDISLAPLTRVTQDEEDVGEGSSGIHMQNHASVDDEDNADHLDVPSSNDHVINIPRVVADQARSPPPDYSSPAMGSPLHSAENERQPLLDEPPIPSYDAAVRESRRSEEVEREDV